MSSNPNWTGPTLRDHVEARLGGHRFGGSVQYEDVDADGNPIRADKAERIRIVARYADRRMPIEPMAEIIREVPGLVDVTVIEASDDQSRPTVEAIFNRTAT